MKLDQATAKALEQLEAAGWTIFKTQVSQRSSTPNRRLLEVTATQEVDPLYGGVFPEGKQ